MIRSALVLLLFASVAVAQDSPLVAAAKKSHRQGSKTPVITNETLAGSKGRLSIAGSSGDAQQAQASTSAPAPAAPSSQTTTTATPAKAPQYRGVDRPMNAPEVANYVANSVRTIAPESTVRNITPESTVRTTTPTSTLQTSTPQSTAVTITPQSTTQYSTPQAVAPAPQ